MSHASTTALCRSIKLQCELYPSREVTLCLDPYCGLGFVLWCLASIYSGHHSILIAPSEVETNPAVWLTAVSNYKVRDTFCSYGVMELCTRGLGTSTATLKQRGINLACVRTCCVIAEERPRIQLTTSFTKLFANLGLTPRSVSTSFGCRVNLGMALQGASCPDPTTVYVDKRAMRNDRVTLVAQDQIWKDHVHHEEVASKSWPNQWGFLTTKYEDLVKDDFQKKDESQKADLKSLMQVKPVTPIEEYIHVEPSNKPVPKTTAQAIGWRSAEKTHQLEKYGKYAKPKGGLVKQLNWPMEGII